MPSRPELDVSPRDSGPAGAGRRPAHPARPRRVLRMALAAGVRGLLLKSVDPSELERAIIHVPGGGRWIDAEVSAAAMTDDCPLTDRELDALRLTTEGLTVREISARLHLVSGTVRNYPSSAMQKTGGSSRHAAARAWRRNAGGFRDGAR